VEEPVKPDTARANRRLLSRRKQSRRKEASAAKPPSLGDDDFDPVEFAEFLRADESLVPPDPGFKERLRQQLWGMVRERAERRRRLRPGRSTLPD
jgi:hypothetical protein